MRVTVLGAGSWGTALAILLARNSHEVTLFGRESEGLGSLISVRENLRYLPGFILPTNVNITGDPESLQESDLWVIAVPSGAVREICALIKGDSPVVVMASKGIEGTSRQLLCDVASEMLPHGRHGVLSGPNLAMEIVRGIPTVAVCAFADEQLADRIRSVFMCRTFRVYTSSDIVGIELAGALKNVLAIGAGMSDALGFGDNTKGAFLARGLHEMASLGLSMGARLDTFLGIAGVGDLFATAASKLSRNYRVGYEIGKGSSLQEAIEKIGQVAEGVSTSDSVVVLGRLRGIPMPTFDGIEAVVRGRMKPMEAVERMMERLPRTEQVLQLKCPAPEE